jgi:hypothetical protein
MLQPMVSRLACLGVRPHLEPKTRFLLLSDSCGVCRHRAPSLMRRPVCHLQFSLTLAFGWLVKLLLALGCTVNLGFELKLCGHIPYVTSSLMRGWVFFFLICIVGGWSPNWVHLARRPFTGLLYLPRVIVRMENLVE